MSTPPAVHSGAGMFRLRSEARSALLTAPLNMTNHFLVSAPEGLLGIFPNWESPLTFGVAPRRNPVYARASERYGGGGVMGNMEPIDRRREPRTQLELAVTIWGVDTRGERFVQEALVRNISLSGALLCGIQSELRSGDVIGLFYRGKVSRYRVIWVRYQEGIKTVDAAIHCIAPDLCPWHEMLVQGSSDEANPVVRYPSDWH